MNLFGQAPWLYVGAYKLAAIGFHMASTALIWSLLGRWKPEQQVWGTLLYAWNPVVLIEFAGSGHNDALLVFLIVLAVWAAQRGRWRGATAGLSASALTKFVSAPLLPLYAVLLARERSTWKSRLPVLGQMAGIALLVAALLYAPFWQGGRVLGQITRQPAIDRTTKSIGTLAIQAWPVLTGALGLGDDLSLAPDDPNLEADQRLSPATARGGPGRSAGRDGRWCC